MQYPHLLEMPWRVHGFSDDEYLLCAATAQAPRSAATDRGRKASWHIRTREDEKLEPWSQAPRGIIEGFKEAWMNLDRVAGRACVHSYRLTRETGYPEALVVLGEG